MRPLGNGLSRGAFKKPETVRAPARKRAQTPEKSEEGPRTSEVRGAESLAAVVKLCLRDTVLVIVATVDPIAVSAVIH